MERTRRLFSRLLPLVLIAAVIIGATAVYAASAYDVKTVDCYTGDSIDQSLYTVSALPGSVYSWQVVEGVLPDGVTIKYKNGEFTLEGTAPDTPMTTTALVQYSQGADILDMQRINVNVNMRNITDPGSGPVSHVCYMKFIDPNTSTPNFIECANGKVGTSYSSAIGIETCALAYEFTVTDPSDLPPGLSVDSQGKITGTPTKAGEYMFKGECISTSSPVAVADHNCSAEGRFIIVIEDDNGGNTGGEDEGYTITIPVTKIVEMDGDVAPPKTDVRFTVTDYMADTEFEVVDEKIAVGSGAGTTNGTIVIEVPNEDQLWNATEGFVVYEQGTKDKYWEYDDTKWIVMPAVEYDNQQNPTVTGVVCYEMNASGDYNATVSGKDGITITNTYTKKDGSDEDYPYTYPNGDYKLKYVSNGGTEYAVEKYPANQVVNLVKEPAREGYTFTGWYLDKSLTTAATAVVMDSDKTVYAGWKKGEDVDIATYKLKYETNGGSSIATEEYAKNVIADLVKVPTKENYDFAGWYSDSTLSNKITSIKMDSDKTVYAGWTPKGGFVPGEEGKYTLTYETNGGSAIAPKTCAVNETVSLTNAPVKVGYTFTGWYNDSALKTKITSILMDADKTVYAGWKQTEVPGKLNGANHFAYIIGYEDGTVRPTNKITRAEVATIFFRLLQADIRDGNLKKDNTFTDSNDGNWYNTAVSTLAGLGIVNGRTSTAFAPNANITRAEFATICARFATESVPETHRFSDIKGHWAEAYIEKAATLGWITGYEDGTFRPDQNITRAEAMTMINRVTQRIPESKADFLSGMRTWSDNANASAWYYLAVQEATNSHDFEKKTGIYERWTKLTADPDWTKYN